MNHKVFSDEYIEQAHKHTIFNGSEVASSSVCTCFYCGNQFTSADADPSDFWDEGEGKEKTLACPLCGIDAVLGDASGFPVTDASFIEACTTNWFSGYSRISSGLKPEKVDWKHIAVE